MITVIIPVYNAAAFVEEAVQSALRQPEVTEIILIEDGSLDESLTICEELSKENEMVTLLKHSEGKNKGAGASRNLGIQHATKEWVAFLDADDFYLENRFKNALQYIQMHPETDALGEPIGAIFHDEKGRNQYLDHLRLSHNTTVSDLVTKVNIDVNTKETFETLLLSNAGSQSIIGLMVNKRVFQKTGLINEKLTIAQDTNFLLKLAYCCNFKCLSDVPPIAIRRIHSGNRWNASLKRRLYFYSLHIQDIYHFVEESKISKKAAKKLVWAYVRSHRVEYFQTNSMLLKILYALYSYIYLIRYNRPLLIKAYI